jgi:hypothetical protein
MMMDMDLNKLVSETLNYQDSEIQGFIDTYQKSTFNNIPESCGVFYNLEQTAGTFVIRIFASSNLQKDIEEIQKHPENFPKLRLVNEEGFDFEKLKFFECDNHLIAQKIVTQLANKRFPKFEENVINVSDPGDSWYLQSKNGEFSLFFNLSRTESIDSLTKLGPLGDVEEVSMLLTKIRPYFSKFFQIEKYTNHKSNFTLKVEESNIYLEEFINLFVQGEIGPFLFQKFIELEKTAPNENVLKSFQKVNYFFMELASIRGFWKQVESELA